MTEATDRAGRPLNTTRKTKSISSKPKPAKAKDDVNEPSHYQITVQPIDNNGKKLPPVKIQVFDLIEALYPNDAHMAHVMTYLCRAGRKKDSSYVKDLKKSRKWITRKLQFLGLDDDR